MKKYQPTVLLILDGWGLAPKYQGNAIELAKKPNFDKLWKKYPHTKLHASGKCVGLPNHDPGNSEAGHMNIGAGRTVLQDCAIIDRSIADKTFYDNLALISAVNHVKANRSRLHLMGLISDNGSPHSSLEHLFALIEFCRINKVKQVYLHLFTDGRDSPQRSAGRIIKKISDKICQGNRQAQTKFELVSLIGRFFAMDRAKNWTRTQKAYHCLVDGETKRFNNYEAAIEHSYNRGLTDEYLEPSIITNGRKSAAETRIRNSDAVIFFNLRSDRARQLTKCFVQKDFNEKNTGAFRRKVVLKNLLFCALTDFGPDLAKNVITSFPGVKMIGTLPFLIANKKQLYIAETEKYAHVTYFINGGYPDPVNREKRIRIPSPEVESYASMPEMSVHKITDKIIKFIRSETYDFIVANFANPDMVGHTGDLAATIKAIEHVDTCLGKVSAEILKKNGRLIVTADHGNAEKMIDPQTGEIFVEHTSNQVPFILVSKKHRKVKLQASGGCLSDIAPTLYELLGVESSDDVSGLSLIKHE